MAKGKILYVYDYTCAEDGLFGKNYLGESYKSFKDALRKAGLRNATTCPKGHRVKTDAVPWEVTIVSCPHCGGPHGSVYGKDMSLLQGKLDDRLEACARKQARKK